LQIVSAHKQKTDVTAISWYFLPFKKGKWIKITDRTGHHTTQVYLLNSLNRLTAAAMKFHELVWKMAHCVHRQNLGCSGHHRTESGSEWQRQGSITRMQGAAFLARSGNTQQAWMRPSHERQNFTSTQLKNARFTSFMFPCCINESNLTFSIL
jgi:hypothetical protein